jgi:integrase
MSTTQPIRSYEDVQKLKNYYLKREEYRNYLLVTVCLNTALRICDVLNLRWCDVLNNDGKIKEHIRIVENKTGKTTLIKLNESIKSALLLYMNKEAMGYYIFENNKKPISRVCAFKVIKRGGRAIGLEYDISCHSLRKTFGYHAWKRGTPPVVLMQIYNHSNYEVTKRYLGISQEDKDGVYSEMML